MSHVSVPGIRVRQETPCAPSSHHQGSPFNACRLPRRDTAAVGLEVEEAAGVEEGITGSTRTPACPTCSRALSKNTWTRCTSGRLTWQGPGTGAGRDTDTAMDPTHTHIPTHTHTGSHQPT